MIELAALLKAGKHLQLVIPPAQVLQICLLPGYLGKVYRIWQLPNRTCWPVKVAMFGAIQRFIYPVSRLHRASITTLLLEVGASEMLGKLTKTGRALRSVDDMKCRAVR